MLALLIPAFFGVVAGVEVIEAADPEYFQLGIGVMVVFFALLLLREIRVPGAGTRWGPVVEGSASGALSASRGLAGPPRDHRNPDPPRPPRLWACSASPAPTTTSPRSKSS